MNSLRLGQCGQGLNSAITVKQCDCALIILYKDRQQGLEDVSGDTLHALGLEFNPRTL